MTEVENLPISGRDPMGLALMAYGVVNTRVRDQNRPLRPRQPYRPIAGGVSTMESSKPTTTKIARPAVTII